MGKQALSNRITRRNIETVARMEKELDRKRTRGERIADGSAAVVGSWTFIVIQSLLLAVWVILNVIAWTHQWDPYPFILLNLALSFQAAYASPIIMMSQNRQARIADRRNQLDLQINLLAEQESTETLRLLRRLCEKAGIDPDENGELEALEAATRPEQLARQIDRIAAKTERLEGQS